MQSLIIPSNWTFKSDHIADSFDSHVREQLPWYDLATSAVAHFGRHYIPKNGLVYDIGASTGNIGNSLRETIKDREARLIAIEESPEMAKRYSGPGELVIGDAVNHSFQPYDFGVMFLTLMFIPVSIRTRFVRRLIHLIKPGGCLVVVDKINTEPGYFGTASRRLSMQWKIQNGVSSEDVIKKELSLAGYQRPIDPKIFTSNAKKFFQLGEFAGWLIEDMPDYGSHQ